jgi:hypothetical protein
MREKATKYRGDGRRAMSNEFITKAHYPTIDVKTILEEHQPSYGLCTECSTFSIYVAYPCAIVKEAIDD